MSVQETPDKHTRAAPYISYSTFKTCLEDFKEHGLPGRIDRSVLTRFSGSVCGQLLTALKFLALCSEDGKPTAFLAALVDAYGTPDWKNCLNQILDRAYKPILAMNLSSATPSQFAEGFASAFPAAEAVLRKCRSFFLAAATDAGFTIGPRLLAGTKGSGSGAPRKRPAKKTAAGGRSASGAGADPTPPPLPPLNSAASNLPPTSFQLVAMLNPTDMNEAEQAAVWTLIQYMKKRETATKR